MGGCFVGRGRGLMAGTRGGDSAPPGWGLPVGSVGTGAPTRRGSQRGSMGIRWDACRGFSLAGWGLGAGDRAGKSGGPHGSAAVYGVRFGRAPWRLIERDRAARWSSTTRHVCVRFAICQGGPEDHPQPAVVEPASHHVT